MPLISRNLPIPERALAIAAHPDDIEFGAGATLAKWAAEGCEVSHLVCTDGSKGSWDPSADQAELVATRQIEQRAAAQALGATGQVVFLGYVDGELPAGQAQRGEVARVIRDLRPDVVLGHDPWRNYRLHPDHARAGLLAVEGIVAARDPHFFPEHGVAPHRPSTLLLFEAERPDHGEDVSGFADPKIAALEAHASQFETTMDITDDPSGDQRERFRRRIRDQLAIVGRQLGVTHAEQFKRMADL